LSQGLQGNTFFILDVPFTHILVPGVFVPLFWFSNFIFITLGSCFLRNEWEINLKMVEKENIWLASLSQYKAKLGVNRFFLKRGVLLREWSIIVMVLFINHARKNKSGPVKFFRFSMVFEFWSVFRMCLEKVDYDL